MSEKNILAYFKTVEDAEKVASELKSLGTTDIQVDRFSKYPGGSIDDYMNPLTGHIKSLSHATLGDINSSDIGVATAVDIAASGMSDGFGEITGRDILVAAIVDDSVYDQAREIVKTNAGLV